MAMPQHKNPCLGDDETLNFSRLGLGHHNSILNLSALCLGVEKAFLKEIMDFHYMTYMAKPQ